MRHGDLPALVLDCGTGARALGVKLMGEPARDLHLLFTHLHMDHVFGLPFFVPIYAPGYRITVSVPAFTPDEAREKLGRYMNGVYHPTRIGDLPAQVEFRAIRPHRRFDAGGFSVLGAQLNHPGGSVGYRIEADGRSVVYMTDTAPFAKPGEGVASGEAPTKAEERIITFLRDAKAVIYDTMFDFEEYLEKMTWGHSYPEYAAALCKAAGVEHLVLFHHLPDASDDQMDALEARWKDHEGLRVTVAREGGSVEI